jgi:prepilin-type processing-associated H-X9-DG protein
MSFTILGIGTATPPHRIAQQEAAEWATALSLDQSHRSTVTKLYRRVGVRTRHSVLLTAAADGVPAHERLYLRATSAEDLGPSISARMQAYEASAGSLAFEASQRALQDGHSDPSSITHLVTVSCSGFTAPGFDVALIRDLQLPPGVQRTHIGFMGCHGALNGLRVAKAFAEANSQACVLLCAVELCSLHHQYQGGTDQIVANALFADGSAAVVGRSVAPSNGSSKAWRLIATGSTIIPETESCMTWQIRDHGFQMGLSPQVPDVIEGKLRPWLECWLSEQQLSIDDVGCWAIHPGGPRILQACAKALDLTDEDLQTSQEVLADYGNMSSPTVLFIVDRLRRAGRRPPCVMLAFGPGLTAEVALLV